MTPRVPHVKPLCRLAEPSDNGFRRELRKEDPMRVVFASWILFVVVGLAYMLVVAVSGR